MKPQIREIIVVEGTHDSERLKRFFDCETIVTHGRGIRREVIEAIKTARDACGVIVFTDPDTPGEALRAMIDKAVPGCMHAYIPKEKARTTRKVGVEHAAYEDLKDALDHVMTLAETVCEGISNEDMLEFGLLGGKDAAAKRRALAAALHISYGNAAKMRKEMNRFGITKETVKEILHG